MRKDFNCSIDSLQWSKAVNIYLVLDMHAAPGGQTGTNIDDSQRLSVALHRRGRNSNSFWTPGNGSRTTIEMSQRFWVTIC